MSLTSTPQAGSDGGRTSTSPLNRVDQPQTSDEAEVPDRRDEAELLSQRGTNEEQQLRLGMSRVPENHGTAEGSKSDTCRGGKVDVIKRIFENTCTASTGELCST